MVVAILFAILIGWSFLVKKQTPPAGDPETVTAQEEATLETGTTGIESTEKIAEPEPLETDPGGGTGAADPEKVLPPEERPTFASEEAIVTLSTRGGAIISTQLSEYRSTVERDSEPLVLDFASGPALSIFGIEGLGTNYHYDISIGADGRSATIHRSLGQGLEFSRTIQFTNHYLLEVADMLSNTGDGALSIPEHGVTIGPMSTIQTKSQMRGISYLGVDTLASAGGSDVIHWGKKLSKVFGVRTSFMSCGAPNVRGRPFVGSMRLGTTNDWAAVKNKYFVQILAPAEAAPDCEIVVTRDRALTNTLQVASVSANLRRKGRVLQPGETHTWRATYYAGPKKYSILRELDNHQHRVMQFGWWEWFRWLCQMLLTSLNGIYEVIPSYGIAIIIVTFVMRVLFWPLTHKSTDSMKRMQAIQPLVTKIREKHKDNPKKMNQEVMALYREHKVNPMASCLPMVAQIPVFIALFIVLRSAVELRFAEFLWIADLSEPEGLLAGKIPLIGALNILPLLMTATTLLQQKMTPTGGDPQQQKIMMFMPVIFLFLFYNMAAALVLYWTISQGLAVAQMAWQRRKRASDPAPEPAAAEPAFTKKPAPAKKSRSRKKR